MVRITAGNNLLSHANCMSADSTSDETEEELRFLSERRGMGHQLNEASEVRTTCIGGGQLT
jgi:hypothetical protein